MVILELQELAEALTLQVQKIQREFTAVQEKLALMRRQWSEAEEVDRPAVLTEQDRLRDQQLALAESVNLWRDRLRGIELPQGENGLQRSLAELEGCGVPEIVEAVAQARKIMAMDPEERAALFQRKAAATATTPAGRLIERGRTSYDLRHDGAAAVQRAAVEFANRSNIALDDAALEELEVALTHRDPIVVDLVARTVAQILRFRALRSAEAEVVRQAVVRLAAMPQPQVVPVLIELLATPRTVYRETPTGTMEESNVLDRLQVLIALVERWRSAEVQKAIRTRVHDMEPQIADAAARALAAFPGEWG